MRWQEFYFGLFVVRLTEIEENSWWFIFKFIPRRVWKSQKLYHKWSYHLNKNKGLIEVSDGLWTGILAVLANKHSNDDCRNSRNILTIRRNLRSELHEFRWFSSFCDRKIGISHWKWMQPVGILLHVLWNKVNVNKKWQISMWNLNWIGMFLLGVDLWIFCLTKSLNMVFAGILS